MTAPITIDMAAVCMVNAQLVIERLDDEEKPASAQLRRGFLTCGELKDLAAAVLALSHHAFPELADEDTLDVALRQAVAPGKLS